MSAAALHLQVLHQVFRELSAWWADLRWTNLNVCVWRELWRTSIQTKFNLTLTQIHWALENTLRWTENSCNSATSRLMKSSLQGNVHGEKSFTNRVRQTTKKIHKMRQNGSEEELWLLTAFHTRKHRLYGCRGSLRVWSISTGSKTLGILHNLNIKIRPFNSEFIWG